MRGSFTEYIWQPCIDSDEAALTRSFASPEFTGSALWNLSMLRFAWADEGSPWYSGRIIERIEKTGIGLGYRNGKHSCKLTV
jgi:hypothetical protein